MVIAAPRRGSRRRCRSRRCSRPAVAWCRPHRSCRLGAARSGSRPRQHQGWGGQAGSRSRDRRFRESVPVQGRFLPLAALADRPGCGAWTALRRGQRRHRAEALRKLPAGWPRFVDSSIDAIVGADLDGTVTSWNASAERIFGYAAAEIVGGSVLTLAADLHDQEDTPGHHRHGQRCLHESRRRRHGHRVEPPGGNPVRRGPTPKRSAATSAACFPRPILAQTEPDRNAVTTVDSADDDAEHTGRSSLCTAMAPKSPLISPCGRSRSPPARSSVPSCAMSASETNCSGR